MKRFFTYHLLLLLALPGFTQKSGLEFTDKTFDHGSVEQWNNPSATFQFTNKGKKNVVFLPTKPSKDVDVSLPPYSIAPGATGTIQIRYYTERKGRFNRRVEIYVNTSSKPISLQVKGNIASFSSDAYMACPTVSHPKTESPMKELEIVVVDSISKEPIHKAKVGLSNGRQSKKYNTDKSGEVTDFVPYDMYDIDVTAKEYYSFKGGAVVNGLTPILYIELVPKITVEEPSFLTSTYIETPVEEKIETVSEPESPLLEKETFIYIPDEEPTTTKEEPEPEEKEEIEKSTFEFIPDLEEPVEEEPVIKEPTPEPPSIPVENPIVTYDDLPPNNVVFLIDMSSSMGKKGKMERLKTSIKQLTLMLREDDNIAIIAYNNKSHILIPNSRELSRDSIIRVIDDIQPKGLTYGVKGIQSAYDILESHYISSGNNQIILATDGQFTKDSDGGLNVYKLVRRGAQNNMRLSVIGFGDDPVAFKMMKKLAHNGKGHFTEVNAHPDQNPVLMELHRMGQ